MPSFRNVSWLTPTTMIGSLLAGVLFALGHHLFYASLNGTASASWNYDVWGFGVNQQQVNTSAGTALAFMVKVCLVLAISIAYTQAFWRAVGKQSASIKTLDVITSLLDNVLAFLRVTTWARYPLLVLLASCVWLIPIASVITPATLSVVVAPVSPPFNYSINVPQMDFRSLKFSSPGRWENTMSYNSPSLEVSRIAQATAMTGSILAIPPPHLNSTWEMTFSGPYLKCENVSAAFRREIQHNVLTAYAKGTSCNNWQNYLAWTANTGYNGGGFSFVNGSAPNNAYSPLPFWPDYAWDFNQGSLGPGPNVQAASGADIPANATDPATIYFATNPSVGATETIGMCPDFYNDTIATNYKGWWDDTPMLQCQLHNATYVTKFNYTNGAQNIDVSFPGLDQAQPVQPLWNYYFDDTICGAVNSNLSMSLAQYQNQGKNCTIDPVTLEQLSYSAIMDAFGKVLVGTVHEGVGGSLMETSTFLTSVLATPLIHTKELAFLADDSTWWYPFQNYSLHYNKTNAELQSLWDWTTITPTKSLAEAVEELFQNITISMLSSPALQPNTSFHAITPAVVTFHDYQTVYLYTAATLWLAYGIAIFLSLLGVIVGLTCIYINGAAFSNDFSTTLRATRNADVSVEIKEQDSDGKDPLPKYIGEATVTFVGGTFASGKGEMESGVAEEICVQPKTPLLGRWRG